MKFIYIISLTSIAIFCSNIGMADNAYFSGDVSEADLLKAFTGGTQQSTESTPITEEATGTRGIFLGEAPSSSISYDVIETSQYDDSVIVDDSSYFEHSSIQVCEYDDCNDY